MLYATYKQKLHEARFTAGMSARYHQKMEWRYALADRSVKLAVGLLAGVSLVFAVPGVDHPYLGFATAIVSLIAAVALNIIPIGDRQTFHAHMLKAWWSARKVAILEERKTCDNEDDKEVGTGRVERLDELLSEVEELNSCESSCWRKMLDGCEADEYEATYGAGIRSAGDVQRQRRSTSSAESALPAEQVKA